MQQTPFRECLSATRSYKRGRWVRNKFETLPYCRRSLLGLYLTLSFAFQDFYTTKKGTAVMARIHLLVLEALALVLLFGELIKQAVGDVD